MCSRIQGIFFWKLSKDLKEPAYKPNLLVLICYTSDKTQKQWVPKSCCHTPYLKNSHNLTVPSSYLYLSAEEAVTAMASSLPSQLTAFFWLRECNPSQPPQNLQSKGRSVNLTPFLHSHSRFWMSVCCLLLMTFDCRVPVRANPSFSDFGSSPQQSFLSLWIGVLLIRGWTHWAGPY